MAYDGVKEANARVLANLEEMLKSPEKIQKWVKGWNTYGLPKNLSTGKNFNGVNAIMLYIDANANGYRTPFYATYNQINALGGSVLKGSKSTIVLRPNPKKFNKTKEHEDGTTTEEEIVIMRYSAVREFNLDQTTLKVEDYITEKKKLDFKPIEEAEKIVAGYTDKPQIEHGGSSAYYRPSEDKIQMPKQEDFKSEAEYYATLLHELSHSTGHKSRLKRNLNGGFGNEEYSKEEIIAELSTAFLTAQAGIDNKTMENSTAYIKSWIGKLKEDHNFITKVSVKAQKSADYITGKKYKKKEAN